MHIYILVVGFYTKLFDLKLCKERENENPMQVVQLTNLSLNDTGYYSCTVRNQYGGVVHTGWVQVG